jgi:RNA polymerase-binding transcription factor DksA
VKKAAKPAKPAPTKAAAKPVKKAVPKKVAKPAPKKAAAKPAKKVAKLAPKKVAAKPVKPSSAKAAVGKKAVAPASAKAAAGKNKNVVKPAPKKVAPQQPVKKTVAKAPVKAAPKVAPKPAPKAPVKQAAAKPVAVKPAPPAAKPVVSKPAPPAPKPAAKAPVKKEKEAVKKAEAKPLVTMKSAPNMPKPAPIVKKHVSTLEAIGKERYTDLELEEFRGIINAKLDEARKDYDLLKQTLANTDNNGTEDTSPSFKMIEDGSETLSREETAQLAARQEKFIKHLEDALLRIRNKTYGICRVTGRLISKERLRLVPHATLSIEAKQQMNN